MIGVIVRYLLAWFSGLFSGLRAKETREPFWNEGDVPAARVAVIGAGVGGCSAAYFLRQQGGENLDIHVFQKPDNAVGGRTAVMEFCGHSHETGASIIHTSNKYLVDFAKKFDLPTSTGKDDRTTPLGIYDGKQFAFRTGNWSFINTLKTFWRYGITLLRVDLFTKAMLKRFVTIYDLQASGRAFTTVPDMLRAMGGDDFVDLTQATSHEYYTAKGWSDRFIDELMTSAIHDNYDQTLKVDAFTTLVALVAMSDGDLWSVVGGNRLIPVRALEASKAIFEETEVLSISRVEIDGKVSYPITTSDGSSSSFDVVIFANPLNTSTVKFNNFPNEVYTNAATTPYQRTIATFVHGEINPAFFGLSEFGSAFPLVIETTEFEGAPFVYRTLAVNVPCELPTKEANEYLKPLCQDPVRTWKVFSPQPLTREQLGQMFSKIDDVAAVDWLAYPAYNPPEEFPSFKLDDGVFYINAIEKAASAMEMSAIGAKNASLLVREYLLSQ